MDADSVIAGVASAVGLAEGTSGVRDVIRAIARAEPVATREISRAAGLPVPIVTAVCSELRKRGVLDSGRPVRLTQAGRDSFAGGRPGLDARCPACHGRGLSSAEVTRALQGELELAAAAAPEAKPELDQTHCTVETKVSRVLAMHEAGALAGRRIIILGDDDLISVAIARFAALTGIPGDIRRLAVLDTDADVLSCIAAHTEGTGVAVELVRHDLRGPLAAALRGAFDVACTDPPYTVPGAELFLSRAVSALGADAGAGILAGTSHLYHLRTTSAPAPLIAGDYQGPLYTAHMRAAVTRPYRCGHCGAVMEVGPGASWSKIADLKTSGCPDCGGLVFRPMALQQ